MEGRQLFGFIGFLSAQISLPFQYLIICSFLKKFLGFKYKLIGFWQSAVILIGMDWLVSRFIPVQLISRIYIYNSLYFFVIYILCEGNIWAKFYSAMICTSSVLLISMTFISLDYKMAPFLLNHLNMNYGSHIGALIFVDVIRESINLVLLYIMLKSISRIINLKAIKISRYQGINLLIPIFASYSIAVLFYAVQQINIDGRNYFLLHIFPNIFYLMPLISFLLLISLLISAYTLKKMIEGGEMQKNNLLIKEQFRQQVNHSKSVEGLYMEIRRIIHDVNNHFICLRELVEKNNIEEIKRYLDNIGHSMTKINTGIQTGHPIADAVINEKYNLAKSHKIEFEYDFILPKEIMLEPMDLCIILSNALDNAIEACIRINDISLPKTVSIKSTLRDLYLIIEITNSTMDMIQYQNDKIISQKGDTMNHGIGISNIATVVKKYDGIMDIFEDKNKFTMNLMFKIKE